MINRTVLLLFIIILIIATINPIFCYIISSKTKCDSLYSLKNYIID